MRRIWIWILGIVLVLSAAAGAAWFVIVEKNEFTLEVELAGEQEILLDYGESYREPGVRATLYGTLLCRDGLTPEDMELTVTGAVDEGKLGRYFIEYTASYEGIQGSARRQVTVIDREAPVITLTPDPQGLRPGVPYVESGFAAYDNYDGDITARVIRTETPGLVTYAVIDSSGNPAYVEREVPYYDGESPMLFLEGGDLSIPAGTFYEEPGYTALDNGDGDLTDQVEREGEVCWYVPGAYPITYTVRDSAGNVTTAQRLVEVTAQPRPQIVEPPEKTIYLTFDDGPGPYTEDLLDVLDEYGVKATFFVTARGEDEILREIVRRGHSIGIHSVTHDYGEIYASPRAFFTDLYAMQEKISDVTGVRTTLMRFPGGSSNTVSRKSCEGIMTTLTRAVQDAGFQYFDWNIYSGDAGGAGQTKTAGGVLENVRTGMMQEGTGIVLQHDIHAFSVEAVGDILAWGLDNGYTFAPLTATSPGYHHSVNN